MKRFLAGIIILLAISAAGALAAQRLYEPGAIYIHLPSTNSGRGTAPPWLTL
jgi:hypothetical protein